MEDVDFSPSSWLSTRKVVLLCMLVLVALSIVGLWDRVIAPSVSVIEDEILGAVAPSRSVRPTATAQPVQVTGMATTESSAAAVEAQIQATVEALVSTPTPVPTMEALAQVATSTPVPAVAVPTAQPVRQLSGSPSVSTVTSTPTPTVDTPAPTPAPPTPESADRFRLSDYKNGLWLRQGHPRLASSITELEWVRDGVNDTESKAIQDLLYIAVVSLPVASSIVALGWVQDGIDDIEAGAFRWMNNISDAGVASSVISLGWVQDGVDMPEVTTIRYLSYIDYSSAEVASLVVAMGWVQDGVDELEIDAIQQLSYLENKDAGAALRILGMPFVATIEPPDVSAIESLRFLAAYDPKMFVGVMSHEALLDGITDDLAPVVATLHGVAKTNPGLIDVLLDPFKVLLERRDITLPLAGDVVLVIIRTKPGAERSMELLEDSVRGAEGYMGLPLPSNFVGLLFEDAVDSKAGTNFGTHIAMLPGYDVDDGSYQAESAPHGIAHEVSHYYWSGNRNWVDEGAADLMASIIDSARTGRLVGVTNTPCAHAANIAHLENLATPAYEVGFRCSYSLGERLFVDLRRTLGDGRFRQGFRDLYEASEIEDNIDNRRGTSMSVEHVREAFRTDDGAESAVIGRWYDGSEPYDLSGLDTGPVDPSLPSINGRIDAAYVTMGTDGREMPRFSAQGVTDWVYLTLESSYSVSGGTHEVALEIVEYYEDGFVFGRRSSKLTAESGYTGGTNWLSVGPSPSRKWAPGRYWVYVYAKGGRKVADVEFEVTP